MSATQMGIAVGIALGFAGAFGGFLEFIIVLVLGAAGFAVGRVLDSELDLASVFSVRRRE
jgi:hypothetical protein